VPASPTSSWPFSSLADKGRFRLRAKNKRVHHGSAHANSGRAAGSSPILMLTSPFGGQATAKIARFPLRVWLLHKAVSEKLLRDRVDGCQSGWV
jgi:hypothetical protein